MSRQADVIVPVYADAKVTVACLESVLAHSAGALGQLIVMDDCSPDPAVASALEELRSREPRLLVLRNESNLGFVRTANRGLALRQRDAVLLNSDTRVTPGWLEELLEGAYSHDQVAAVVPLSNNATLCSVPRFGEAAPASRLEGDLRLGQALPRFTQMPTGVGFCLLLRDQVLNMIGGFDPAFGRGYNEENDWCVRASQHGFVVLRANRALVYHLGHVSFGEERSELDRRNARLLSHRHPHYLAWNKEFEGSPEAHLAATYVRHRLGELQVCLEASSFSGALPELEFLRALRDEPQLKLSGRAATPAQRAMLEDLGIPTVPSDGPLSGFSVLHQPSPPSDWRGLRRLLQAPCLTIVGSPDLLALAPQPALSWAALHSAQAVIALSEHNRQQLLREFHLPPERVHTVYPGIDPDRWDRRDLELNHSLLQARGLSGPYFLYAGGEQPHHNLKLLLAGHALYRARAAAAAIPLVVTGRFEQVLCWPMGVSCLGPVGEAERLALTQEAQAVLLPSAHESFPFAALEAQAAGVPLIASSLTSLPEVAGEAALFLRDFTPEELASCLAQVAARPELRQTLSASGLARCRAFGWRKSAHRLAAVYAWAVQNPAPSTLSSRRMLSQLLSAPEEGQR